MKKREYYRKITLKFEGNIIEVEGWSPIEIRRELVTKIKKIKDNIAYWHMGSVIYSAMINKFEGTRKPILNGVAFEYTIKVMESRLNVVVKTVFRPMDEFNGMTPQESLDYIKGMIDPFECDDERLSDAIKRLQVLIDEAK